MPRKKALTEHQIKWLVCTGRKRYTLTELSARLQIGVTTTSAYLIMHGVKAVTRKHQLIAAVIKAAINGKFTNISSMAKKLHACEKQVRAIVHEYKVFPTAPNAVNAIRGYTYIPMTQERARQLIETAYARGCVMLRVPKQKTKQPTKKDKIKYVKELLEKQKYML